MLRLLLIRHGSTQAVRDAAFPSDEGLEESARARAEALAASLPRTQAAFSGPERACRETATCLDLGAVVEQDLAGCEMGSWRGRTLEDVQQFDPEGLLAWMTEPSSAPHGGESLADHAQRVRHWLERISTTTGFVVAVVDAAVIKAAVCTALDAPGPAFWRVDVSPLARTELHARSGRWTVRCLNAPWHESADSDTVGFSSS